MAENKSEEINLPVVKHLYQNAFFDTLRWNFFQVRDDDIVVATSYKAGTTWMQGIVANLVFSGQKLPAPLHDLSPWLDHRIVPLEVVLTGLEQQKHRRFIKTHLPLDGLPYDRRLKYIYVARDARDVFMSFWNHYRNFTDMALALHNMTPGRVGPDLPPCPEDPHELWRGWMTRGWFEWETEGYPWWSNLHHVQSWWDYRHLPNILFVHYADLLADLEGGIRRVARFLDINVPESVMAAIVRNCTLAEMRASAEEDFRFNLAFKGGAKTFFNKGTNGRWREILSEEELALYDAAAKRELTPECRRWLENGATPR
jgi:aryl sulfotransferase